MWSGFQSLFQTLNVDPRTPAAPGAGPPAPTGSSSAHQGLVESSANGPSSSRTISIQQNDSTTAEKLGVDDWQMIRDLRGIETSPHTFRFNLEVDKPLRHLDRIKWLFPNAEDISKVGSLLTQQPALCSKGRLSILPFNCVMMILDFAGYNECVETEKNLLCSVHDGMVPYLVSEPIPGPLKNPVRRITFEIRSHDQGWSGEPLEFKGTYEHSCTWFQANLVRSDDIPKIMLEDREAWPEFSAGKHKILWNKQAQRHTSRHVVVLDANHELVREAKSGDRVVLWLGACFGGWNNYCDSASIRISVAQ